MLKVKEAVRECPIMPAPGRVVVVRKAAREASKGGILLPETAREKAREGEVLAYSPAGSRAAAMDARGFLRYEQGQTVLFGAYSGTEVDIEDKKGEKTTYLVLEEGEILGVLA